MGDWVLDHRRNNHSAALVCTVIVHRELRCEDCDVLRMRRSTLESVGELRREGRITQEDYEAFEWLHWQLSPYRGERPAPADENVRRIIGKLIQARPDLADRPELEVLRG